MVGFGSDSDEELNFPEEEEEPKMVDQMQLIKRKTLPERQPPVAKDKGKEKQIEIEEDAIPQQKKNPPMPDSNIFSNFKKLPALLSIFDALCMSKELRDVLIYALQHPELYQASLFR